MLDRADSIALLGVGLVLVGVGSWSVPAAAIIGGLVLVAIGAGIARSHSAARRHGPSDRGEP